MKKILSIVLIMVMVISCLGALPVYASYEHTYNTRNECEEKYNIAYYTSIEYKNSLNGIKITSLQELTDLVENKVIYQSDCDVITSRYNEEVFEDSFLYIIQEEMGDTAERIRITSINTIEDTVGITVANFRVDLYGGCAIVPWTAIVALDKSLLDKPINITNTQIPFLVSVQNSPFDKNDLVLVKAIFNNSKILTVGDDELYRALHTGYRIGLIDAKNITEDGELIGVQIVEGTPTTFKYGNLDDDEAVDSSDLHTMKLAIKGSKALEGKYLIASDVDRDGLCDSVDLQAMKLRIKSGGEFVYF